MNQSPRIEDRILIVSIHDHDERGVLSFDLVHIVEAIAELVMEYSWMASEIDCIGATVPVGVFLSTDDLLGVVRQVSQTIDGVIMGFPENATLQRGLEPVVQIADFPRLPATIAIIGVDSSYFEVFSKIPAIIDRVKSRFKDVCDENAASYF